jgi:pyruvate dehydrogenase E2 component (dihydrolipoamide acetyltransferase)
MTDFKMPALGADMEAGTLVEWCVKPGDRVKSGDVIAVVETQKGAIEVEVFTDGVVSSILAPLGERVPVGTVLARIEDAEERPTTRPESRSRPGPAPETVAAREIAPTASSSAAAHVMSSPASRIKISPVARRRATALNLDLSGIVGSGVGGAIRLADVDAATTLVRTAPPPERHGLDLAAMRNAIAAAMSRSKREIPHYYLSETVDLHAGLGWLERLNAEKEPVDRLLLAVLFLKAAALALHEHPRLNGVYENGAFIAGDGVHIGWAIALRGGGLVAPAIRDADKKTLAELMAAMRDLVERARHGRLRGSELASPTITVTNVGERGAEMVSGVIYPPQVAIVGFGRVVTRPWVVDGQIESRPLVTVSLSADHRVTDGHLGGLYLTAIARLLQEPEKL